MHSCGLHNHVSSLACVTPRVCATLTCAQLQGRHPSQHHCRSSRYAAVVAEYHVYCTGGQGMHRRSSSHVAHAEYSGLAGAALLKYDPLKPSRCLRLVSSPLCANMASHSLIFMAAHSPSQGAYIVCASSTVPSKHERLSPNSWCADAWCLLAAWLLM